ncbi:MAG: glycosyltransferase, partial [bacterium]|nr:glycosyltransferase [bacterium]
LAKQQIPGLELDIYGDGEEAYLDELKSRVRTQGLSESVRFHDRVPVDQVPDLIRNAHLGLVPCKRDVFVDKVMLPVRLLEYVVMGLPAVVARVETVEAYFKDDEVAYYPPDNAALMAERIVELYHNPAQVREMSVRAQKAFSIYEWPKMQNRYYGVLDRLLNS